MCNQSFSEIKADVSWIPGLPIAYFCYRQHYPSIYAGSWGESSANPRNKIHNLLELNEYHNQFVEHVLNFSLELATSVSTNC